jgi:uncharacterized membrane protein HdeD (DUF308 family)
MEIRLFKNWWLMSIKGVLSISYGTVMLILQYSLIRSSLAISFGLIVVFSGALIITGSALSMKSNPHWRWWLMEGLLDLVIGAIFILKPNLAKAFFLFFLALWSFSIGLIQIVTSFRMTQYMERWWTMLGTGIFSILFSVLIFINPFYANYNLGTIIGLACIVFGLSMLYISRILRNIYF